MTDVQISVNNSWRNKIDSGNCSLLDVLCYLKVQVCGLT